MLSSLLAIIGGIYLIYIFWIVRKLNKKREKRLKELEIVYSMGLKEYNKSLAKKLNQTPSNAFNNFSPLSIII